MDGARVAALWRRTARAAARRRDAALDARLAHPIFDPLRPWLEALGPAPGHDALNAAAERARVRQAMRFVVLGHATLEQVLAPWSGITCKALIVDPAGDLDAQAAAWLARLPAAATPRLLAPLPVFGFPGWLPGGEHAAFYDDARFFRPLRA